MVLYDDFNMIEQIVCVFLCEQLGLQNKVRFTMEVSSIDEHYYDIQNIQNSTVLNETNSEMDILYSRYSRKEHEENNRDGDFSSLLQRHCQTNRLNYKQALNLL